MKIIYLITLVFFALNSCKKNENNSCINHYKLYRKYYRGISTLKPNSQIFKIKYDSTNYYLDKYMECYPNSVELIRYKLGLLTYNKDYKKMIPYYNKLIQSDSLTIQEKKFAKFARFYYMLITDSVKYKKDIKYYYYKEVKEKEPKVNELLKNLSENQLEIYKRIKLSYYFEGRNKTLEDFKYLKDTMPYKLNYLTVQEQSITPLEFLKVGMD